MTAIPSLSSPGDLSVTGRLLLPQGWGRGTVWITAGQISAVTAGEPTHHAGHSIDVGEAFVLPGAVDAHVHSLSHAGEGISAATAAAAAGGVTTIIEMPFDAAGAINTPDRLRAKQDLVEAQAHIDVALLATLAPDGGHRHAAALAEVGAVGFKVSLFLTDPVRFPRISDAELPDVMAAVTETGTTLCTHAENNEIIQALLAEHLPLASTDPRTHALTRPPVAETLGVLTAMEIAADRGASLHLCHLSLPRSVDLVGWYRSQGVDVTSEACPHYLTFTDADLDAQRGRLKINPPLREETAREGLWQALAEGRIDVISSDHAPWPLAWKDHDIILDNHSGVPGVETLVAATLGGALARDPGLELFAKAVDALTLTPATRYGIAHRKGTLSPGKDADLMVFTPGEAVLDQAALHSNAGWSPYHGRDLGGRVSLVIARGQVVFDGRSVVSSPGQGSLVGRSA